MMTFASSFDRVLESGSKSENMSDVVFVGSGYESDCDYAWSSDPVRCHGNPPTPPPHHHHPHTCVRKKAKKRF